jgi:hypothetical protein
MSCFLLLPSVVLLIIIQTIIRAKNCRPIIRGWAFALALICIGRIAFHLAISLFFILLATRQSFDNPKRQKSRLDDKW